ncbi:MAG: PAS domain-containing protein [Burkholderiales bacterium]|nr:PAS domain-containing protein [Burkholderiales bacterium]
MKDKETRPLPPADADRLFAGASEMAARMRAIDWSKTPLGPVGQWPQSLKIAIRVALDSRFPMFVWWGRGLIKFYNDAYIPVLGKKHPAALAQPAAQVWAEIWDVLGPQTEAVLNDGRATWNEEVLLVMARYGYAEETWFTWSYSPVPDDDGSIGGVFCACTEDTQRVLTRRRLRTLRDVAEAAAVAQNAEHACELSALALGDNPYDLPFVLLYLLDADGNEASLRGAAGMAPGTPASPHLIPLFANPSGPADSTPPASWPLAEVSSTRLALLVDAAAAGFDDLPGGAWPEPALAAMVLPIAMPGKDALAGFVVAGISPRRQLDDDYRGFFDLVADHVLSAISNAQAHEQERQRAEALAELNRAKTTFFANVSHEFRTPLTLLLAPTEEALDEESDAAQRERLELVQRNALRLQKLVNTLLDFSRIESGRAQVNCQPVDLAALTVDLCSVFRSAIDQAGLLLCVDCPPLSQPVFVDREMWEKIVLNLVSNAFKFTFKGQITVALKEREGGVELAVRDTGIGVPEHALPHLFERFYRVEGAQGRTYEGSGIGLAMVQEFAKFHGGRVAVESRVDEGSAFTVSLPLGGAHPRLNRDEPLTQASATLPAVYVKEALNWLPPADKSGESGGASGGDKSGNEDQAPQDRRKTARAGAGWRGKAPTGSAPHWKGRGTRPLVLLADDNSDMRSYLSRLLIEQYDVEAVADGDAALAAVRARKPDLVVSDVMMPRVGGFDLLRRLRADKETAAIPVILLSARSGEESRMEGLAAGADDYLVKPFNARELSVRVEACIKLARTRREAEERVSIILESITDGFISLDRDWRFVYINAEGERICAMRRADIMGLNFWQVFAPVLGTEAEKQYRRAVAEKVTVSFEYLYEPWRRWFSVSGYPTAGGGLSIYFRDITLHKHAEALQTGQARVLELIAEGAPLTEALDLLARTLEAQSSTGMKVSILLLDPDGIHLRHGAGPSLPDAYKRAIDGVAIGPNLGSCGRAASSGQPVYANDIASDPHWTAFADLARNHHLGACWSTPIRAGDGPVLGTFALYYSEPHAPSAEDLRLIDMATHTAAIAIERKGTGERLLETRASLRTALEAGAIATWNWDVPRNRVKGDANLAAFFSVPGAENEGAPLETYLRAIHPADLAHVSQRIDAALAEGDTYEADYRLVKPDGGLRWVTTRGRVERDAQGKAIRLPGVVADISARKAAEESMRDSKERLDFVLDVATLGQWDMNLVDRTAHRTLRHDQIFGYPALLPEWTYEMFLAHVLPEDRPAADADFQRALTGDAGWNIECRIRRADGEVRWIWVSGRIQRNPEGGVVRMLGTVLDISDRKRAEANLLESETRYRLIADASNDVIWDWNLATDEVTWNEGVRTVLGFATDAIESSAKWRHEHIHPEDRNRVVRGIHAVIDSGANDWSDEYRYLRADGTPVHVCDRGRVMHHDSGKPCRMVGAMLDLTERNKAEAALRESEETFRTMADSISQLAWMARPDGHIFWYNRRWYDYTGTTLEQMQGWGWQKVHHPEHEQRVVEKVSHCFATGEVWEDTFPLRGADRRYRWFLSRAVPVRDAQGHVLRWFGTNTDITEQMQSEDRLREGERRYREVSEQLAVLNEGLERRVAERTELAERRATQLRSLATQLTQAEARERRRIAEILHDSLQQMLLSAKFKLGVMKNRTTELNFAPVIDILDQSIQASRALTADLSPPILYQLNLTAALEWLAPRLLAQQGLRLEVVPCHEEPPLSDESKALLYQAISELLLNIVKHAHTDRARVVLKSRWGGDWLIVRVEDQGSGFDAAQLSDIGGFGLFGIRERLEFLGGRSVIRSRPGRGTSISLIVPTALTIPETTAPRAARLPGTVQPVARVANSVARVLLVDDHAMVRDGLRGILEGESDFQVVGEAANGIRAVEMAAELQPDIVLMDINMPGMDGIEATRRIKAALPKIQIIGLSMHADEGVKRAMVAAGASAYVTKDVVSDMLCGVMRERKKIGDGLAKA